LRCCHCANSDDDANARGVHNTYADADARDGHADCCCKSERNRDRHGDDGPQPGPDLDGESNPEHRADGNTESQSYPESYADAGAHPDENTGAHINARKSADHASAGAISDNNKIAVIGARVSAALKDAVIVQPFGDRCFRGHLIAGVENLSASSGSF